MRTGLTNLKRIVAVLVILCLMFSLIPANTFAVAASDISGHWAQVTIQSWIDKDLIKGYPDGTFKPDQNVTRAEFMTLANRAFGFTAKATINYTDVQADAWYTNAIAIAKAAGYISGYPDGTMKPENPITREETATIIARLQHLNPDVNAAGKYTDAAKIGSWSKGQVGAVTSAKIMQGYPDGSFMPQGLMTRAEVVVASDNALHYTAPLVGTSNVAINAIGDATVVVGGIATKTVTTTPADATVTAVSGTTAVAVVSITGHNITVTGVSAGTSKITVTGSKSGYGNGTATWTVTVIPVPVVSGGSAPAPTIYTVTFDSQGGTPTPDPTTGIAFGDTVVTLPADPTYAGYTFNGWFTAATDGTAFAATTTVTANVTVYAQWTAVVPTTYAVTFTVADAMYAIVGANITIASHTLSTDVYGVATINLRNGTYPYDVTATGYDATNGSAIVNGAAVAVPVTMTATAAPVQLTIADPTLTLSKVADETTTAAVTAGALAGVAGDDDVTVSAAATYDTAAVGTGKTITVVYTLGGADAAKYVAPVNYTVATGEITGAPYATVPSAIHLAIGSTAPVGGVTDVAIPAAGATDTTGAVTGWVTATHDKIKFTVTDAGGATSTITINAGVYTSEADYTITAASALTIVVTTTEAGKTPAVRTFTVTVAPTICGHDIEFGGFTSKVTILGTDKTGYAIYNAAQLQHMAMHPTENAILMNDIVIPDAIGTTDTAMGVLSAAAIKYGFTSGHDISQFTSGNFVPIGFFESHTIHNMEGDTTVIDVDAPYTGIFDGNGHTISGLNIDGAGVNYVGSVGYVGLFGYTLGAEIENLIIKDATVKGLKYVGGVAGYMNGGSIANVSTTGNGLISGNVDQGGIVGFATDSIITNVSNNLAIQGDNVGGGIAGGITRSTLSYARNTGTIKAPCAGGLVGLSNYSTVEFSYNTGIIGGNTTQKEGWRGVGGLVGENDYSIVSYSYNTGSVAGQWQWIGGVVGISNGNSTTNSQIVNVYNTGTVNGHDDVGGIVGYIGSYNQISYVYNTGAVTGTATVYGTIDYIGGIVGDVQYSYNSLNNSYNTGMVSGGGTNIGSVAGYVRVPNDNNTVSTCYWLATTYTKGIGVGSGSTTSFASSDSGIMKTINDAISAITAAANVAATPVAFSTLTANGTSTTVSTTVLTLTFDVEPTTLVVGDITVTGATKGALAGTGTTRTLAISAITVLNGADVTVAIANPAGFTITSASKTVAVNVAAADVLAVGTAAAAVGTKTITYTLTTGTFDATAGAVAANWTLAGTNFAELGAITLVALSGSNTVATITVTNAIGAVGRSYTIAPAQAAFAAGFTAPAAAATIELLKIGDSYGGGKVAYILQSGDTGYVSGVTKGLIAATEDQSTGIAWAQGTTNQSTAVTGTSYLIGYGSANTTLIVTQNGAGSTYAAGLCDAYSVTVDAVTYSDWYLPSRNELVKLYSNRTAIGGFNTDSGSSYWSSSEENASQARYHRCDVDGDGYSGKSSLFRVRAVRSF